MIRLSLIEEKFTTDKFDRKKKAFFKNFGWKFMPFAQKDSLPDPELLVPHQIEEVQEIIDLVKDGDLVSFITSEIGMGKTTLSKFLAVALPQQDDQNIVSVFLHGPSIENREQMLRLILERLELQTKEGDLAFEFEKLRSWPEEYPDFLLTIIVDEFPDVSKDALEIVRSVADLENIVWILNGCDGELLEFVGNNAPALLERRRYTLHLRPMNQEEIREMLIYRMAWARGGDYDTRSIEPFTGDAVEKIYKKSGGAPRRALKLASEAVYTAIEKDKLQIDSGLIYERKSKKERGGSFWSFLPFVGE